jgi:hypothetical protein
LEPTLVVQGPDHDEWRELSSIGPEAGRVLDSALADLVTVADKPRGEDADGTSGGRVLPGARDVPDGTTPERIRSDRIDPTELVRPVGLPPRVGPVERGIMRTDSITDALLGDWAVAAVGLAGRVALPADSIVRREEPQEPRDVLAKLAATLIVAGSWGHRARFRGVTSGPAGRLRYRKEPE